MYPFASSSPTRLPIACLVTPSSFGEGGDARALHVEVGQQIGVRKAEPGVSALAELGQRTLAKAAVRVPQQAPDVVLAQRFDGREVDMG